MTKSLEWHRRARALFRRGYKNAEIAELLGQNESTVRSVTAWVRLNEGVGTRTVGGSRSVLNGNRADSGSSEVDHHIKRMEMDSRGVYSELKYWNDADE